MGLITHIVICLSITHKGGQGPTLGCSAIDDEDDDDVRLKVFNREVICNLH
jgi:hypothetical protein